MTGATGRGFSAGFSGSVEAGAGCLGRVVAGCGAGLAGGAGAAGEGGAVVVCGSVGGAVEGVASVGGGVETEGGLAFTMLRWQPAAPSATAQSATAISREPHDLACAVAARRFIFFSSALRAARLNNALGANRRLMFMRFMRAAP